jgi:hypothetical protein
MSRAMDRHDPGPRRSESVDSYIRETRAIAGVAVLALVAGVVSDLLAPHFWANHALLAGLAASVIVVVLTVAVVNEAVERRRRGRWSVLAQYVMLQLVRDARLVWTAVAQLAGLMPSGTHATVQVGNDIPDAASIDEGARAVRDTPRLAAAIHALVADAGRRQRLHDKIVRLADHSDEVLGRWAAVMLNADVYAEVIDRHVELAGDLAWLGSLLDHFERADDRGRQWRGRSHVAVQIEGKVDDERLADRLLAITQLAERLDRGTLELALRIVPVEWWAARLGTTVPTVSDDRDLSTADPPLP